MTTFDWRAFLTAGRETKKSLKAENVSGLARHSAAPLLLLDGQSSF
jgi:hypothetical protein